MNIQEVKQYLEKQLPEFTYLTGKEAKQPKKNWNCISVTRDGQSMVLDVEKVEDINGAKKLKEFIEIKWKGVK